MSESPAFLDCKPGIAKAGGDPQSQTDQGEPGCRIDAPIEINARKESDEYRQGHLQPKAAVIRKVSPGPPGFSFHVQEYLKKHAGFKTRSVQVKSI